MSDNTPEEKPVSETATTADAEGKSIDFSSMLNSALELKKLFDLILKQ